jgi:sugar porter (SP) family MFS transporter
MEKANTELDQIEQLPDKEAFNFEGLTLLEVVPKREKYWWHYRYLRNLNLLLLSGIMWSTASGFDGSLFNGMQALPQWKDYFNNPTGLRLSLSSVPNTIANIIGNVVCYWFADRFGRRYNIMTGCILIIVSAILRGAAQNYAWWVWVQVIQGLGTAFVSVSAPPYITETAYPTHRARAVSLYAGTYAVGGLIAAGMNYGLLKVKSTWGWRITVLAQVVPSTIQLILAIFAPESPRWLIYKDRSDEAFDILVKYHAGGDVNSQLVHFEMAEIRASLEQEKLSKAGKWIEWVKTKGNRHRLAIVIVIPMSLQWVGNALISYYLPIVLSTVGITDANTVLGINLGNSAFSLTGSFISFFVIDRFGRRRLMLTGYCCLLVILTIWTACSAVDAQRHFADKGLAAAVVLMIYLFGACYHLVGATASPYIMEISPYSLRSKAAGLYQLCGSLPGLYNTWTNPIAMDAIGWKYYIVWTCLTTVWLTFCYFFVPETKGKGLEEINEVFDGHDVISGTNAMKLYGLEGRYEGEYPTEVGR